MVNPQEEKISIHEKTFFFFKRVIWNTIKAHGTKNMIAEMTAQ